MEKMVPLGGRILLHREVKEKVGSIILPPDAAKRNAPLRCTILDTGPACEWGLKPGEEVLIGRLAGTWINMSGKPITEPEEAEYFIVQEEDILVVFEETEPKIKELKAV